MSDVPLGVFLSGGLDSSAIAAIMARLDRPAARDVLGRVQGARVQRARRTRGTVADAIGADAHEVVIDDRDFFDALPRLVWHEDEPIAHPSSVPLYFVSALAQTARHGRADRRRQRRAARRLRHDIRASPGTGAPGAVYERCRPGPAAIGDRDRLVPQPARTRWRAMPGDRSSRWTASPEAMFFDNFASVRLAEQRALLVAGTARQRHRRPAPTPRRWRTSQPPGSSSTLLDRLLYADIKTYLVELLMKQDQMSMAASIESRVPFLDHELVEFAARLPDEWKLSGLTTKRVLREAMKSRAAGIDSRPAEDGISRCRSRSGRAADGTASSRDVLLDRPIARARHHRPAGRRSPARRPRGRAASTARDRIWSLLNLELWFRTFIDKDGVQTLGTPAGFALQCAFSG